jgi:hypothetical protein
MVKINSLLATTGALTLLAIASLPTAAAVGQPALGPAVVTGHVTVPTQNQVAQSQATPDQATQDQSTQDQATPNQAKHRQASKNKKGTGQSHSQKQADKYITQSGYKSQIQQYMGQQNYQQYIGGGGGGLPGR